MRQARTVAAGIAAISASVAFGQQYELVDLGTLGGSTSEALAISPNGTVAGWATTPQSVKHAVLWTTEGIVDLGAPAGFIVTEAVGVNDLGQVAANIESQDPQVQGYFWENGTWTSIGALPGHQLAIARDIDAQGRVVGSSLTFGAGNGRGVVWANGALTELGTLGGAAAAFAINDDGVVVGRSQVPQLDGSFVQRAVMWQNGATTNLGVLDGEDHSQAFGINEAGDVVGSSWIVTSPTFLSADQASRWPAGDVAMDLGRTPGPQVCVDGLPFYTDNIARAVNDRGQVVGDAQCVSSGAALAAFLVDDGVMHNLNDLVTGADGWNLLSARDVNDAGRIVGFGLAPNGALRAFALVPACASDVSGDGVVDFTDLLQVLSAWGPCGACDEDLDDSGVVDFGDLLAVLSAWGPCA